VPVDEEVLELPAAAEAEEVLFDYAALGLTLRSHPVALLRAQLSKLKLQTAAQLRDLPSGRLVRACGIVVMRQRPQTAKGVTFVTLEDETGSVNVIVWKSLQDKQRAELLRSRLYHGQTPLSAGAFPGGASPLAWTGIVETENRLERFDLSLATTGSFDPDAGRTYFKPEPSPALDAALKSALAQEYLKFARFPKATVEKTVDGYRVELRDLRPASPLAGRGGLIAIIELNRLAQVTDEALRFASAP